jgi:hypothetical protein
MRCDIRHAQTGTRFHEKRVFRAVMCCLVHLFNSNRSMQIIQFEQVPVRSIDPNPGRTPSGRAYCASLEIKSMTTL